MPPWLDQLVLDHAMLRALARRLDGDWVSTATPLRQDLSELLLFLDQHSGREEDTLFRVLDSVLPTGRGPLAVAKAEHVALDAVCNRLRLAMLVLPNHRDQAVATQTMRHDLPLLLNLLERHLTAEEIGLFPLAADLS